MKWGVGRRMVALLTCLALTACGSVPLPGARGPFKDELAPAFSNVETAHQLVDAGRYELAIKAFNRAALDAGGFDAEILSGLGSAHFALGRLGQAETLYRRAAETPDASPETWNNLAVVLMERGKTSEAIGIFQKAYALDDGESTLIRDNLRLALTKVENRDTVEPNNNEAYKLVRRGTSDYLLSEAG